MTYDFSNLSVFVINETKFTQNLVANLLRCMNITQIKTFYEVSEAIAGGASLSPDVMVMDYLADGQDGRDGVRLVRQQEDERLAFVPIIVVSAYTEYWRVTAARDAGATEIVALPVSVRVLYKTLTRIATKPRPFVRTPDYFGPDRRRKQRPFEGPDRRQAVPCQAAAPDAWTEV